MTPIFGGRRYADPQLGELKRSGRCWVGELTIRGSGQIYLELDGTRTLPDENALSIARELPERYESLKPEIQNALFEHYEPYRTAADEGYRHVVRPFPEIPQPAAVWQRVKLFGVHVKPLAGQPEGDQPTLELVYEVDWDDDHLLGVRMLEWRIWEVCGSA